jgi:hypothetical protein
MDIQKQIDALQKQLDELKKELIESPEVQYKVGDWIMFDDKHVNGPYLLTEVNGNKAHSADNFHDLRGKSYRYATPEEIVKAKYGSLKLSDLKGKKVAVQCDTQKEWDQVLVICKEINRNSVNFHDFSNYEKICLNLKGSLSFGTKSGAYCDYDSISAKAFIEANPVETGQVIIHTEDGVDLYYSDKYYYYELKDGYKSCICNIGSTNPKDYSDVKDCRYFSTEAARDKWIEENVYTGKWKVGDVLTAKQLNKCRLYDEELGAWVAGDNENVKWDYNRKIESIHKIHGNWCANVSLASKKLHIKLSSIPEIPTYKELTIGNKDDKITVQKNSIFWNNFQVNIIRLKRIIEELNVAKGTTVLGDYKTSILPDTRFIRIGCDSENHLFSINEIQQVIDTYEELNK